MYVARIDGEVGPKSHTEEVYTAMTMKPSGAGTEFFRIGEAEATEYVARVGVV